VADGDILEFPKFNYRVVADLAHELRTPIGGVMGMNELLLMQINDPEQKMFSQSVDASGRTLLAMLLDIVDLAKIENETVELVVKPLVIKDMLELLKFALLPQLSQEGTDLKVVEEEGVEQTVTTDTGKLKQLLSCLILAVYKYTGSGPITMTARVASASLYIRISLPPNTVQRDGKSIFSQLVEGDADAKRFDMTWLRLRLATRLVTLLKAELKVSDTSVELSLPV
jgi:signal transduction histidine kinase